MFDLPFRDRQDARLLWTTGPVEAIIMRSLAKHPDDRFRDAREMRKELEQVL